MGVGLGHLVPLAGTRHQGAQSGEGDHLDRLGVLGRLRDGGFEEGRDSAGRHPRRKPRSPEPGQGRGVRRCGQRADQGQPSGALGRRALLDGTEGGLPPPHGRQLGTEDTQLPRDGVLQSAARPARRVPLVEDAAHGGDGQVQGAQGADHPQPLERVGTVPAVAAGAAGRFGQQAVVGVEAHRLDADTRPLGELADAAQSVVRREHLNLPQGEFLRYPGEGPGHRVPPDDDVPRRRP